MSCPDNFDGIIIFEGLNDQEVLSSFYPRGDSRLGLERTDGWNRVEIRRFRSWEVKSNDDDE